MQTPVLAALPLLAYLLGAIPTALLISRAWYGKDIREVGSGNAGSTNTYRAFGFKAGALVQVVDIAKGSLAVLTAIFLGLTDNIAYLCGLAAVLGHIYPVWAGFRGGKGMNTLLGAFLLLDLQATGIALGVFALALLLASMVSLSSILAVISLPVTVYVRAYLGGAQASQVVQLLAVGFPILILYTHRSNVGRILAGKERRVRFGLNAPRPSAE